MIDILLAAAVAGVASYRVWRLLAHDRIGEAARTRLIPEGTRRDYWLGCPWCSGAWVNLAMVAPLVDDWASYAYTVAVASVITGWLGDRL